MLLNVIVIPVTEIVEQTGCNDIHSLHVASFGTGIAIRDKHVLQTVVVKLKSGARNGGGNRSSLNVFGYLNHIFGNGASQLLEL